jgi:hypothetical protein
MTFEEVADDLRQGRAVSRVAWGNPNILVRLAKPEMFSRAGACDQQALRVLSSRSLDKADLAADDWFAVGSLH